MPAVLCRALSASRRIFRTDMLERSADGVLIMSSNSLSRSETSMNLLSAISEAITAIFVFAHVLHFRGDEDLLLILGVGGSTKMPGITAGGTDNLLLSLPRTASNGGTRYQHK